jgi:4'-phosphopantetheinyl transferase EntD
MVLLAANTILGILPIQEDSESILSQLDRKGLYSPTLASMIESRRREWLSVRLLLKNLTGEEKEIGYLPSGKPYLADNSYHISISHTKGYVAVILHPTKEVAIDIEHLSPRVEKIRSRFMSEEEERNLSPDNPLIHLMLHWSAKECLFKRINQEEVEFQTQLHIHPFEPRSEVWDSFAASETHTEAGGIFTVHYYVSKKYVLTYLVDA